MDNFFIGTKDKPYHISTGGVVINKDGKIMTHKFPKVLGKSDVYSLMRMTPEPEESLQRAVKRGVKEEFGADVNVGHYITLLHSSFPDGEGNIIEKLTYYFSCELVSEGVPTKKETLRGVPSEVGWYDKDFLVANMKKQREAIRRSDFDESEVLLKV